MVPEELRQRSQWLVWRYESQPGDKKPRKVPYYIDGSRRQGVQGSPEDRLKLVLFDAALNAKSRGKYDGVGFAFLPGDGLIGIDLDNMIDPDSGEVAQRAVKIMEACSSYTELSPSRRGVHIFVKGTVDRSFKSNEIGVEVFCGAQFFTFTGEHYAGTPETVNLIPDTVLRRLRATVDQAKGRRAAGASAGASAQEIVGRAKVESALALVSPDCGYDDWIAIGMAIHAELGEGGLAVWDYWSSRGAKYPGAKALESHWRSFRSGDGITGATLFKMARDAGWRPPGRPKAPTPRAASGSAGTDAAVKGDSGKRRNPPPQAFNWKKFFERFTYIYPTETAWDADEVKLVKISAMKIMFGKGVVDFWLNSLDPRSDLVRRTVSEENVVFDPSCSCDPKTSVNLFKGMPMSPAPEGKCEKLLELLQYLCGEADQDQAPVTDWLLNWIAYPLQHLGTKMQTAVVMYGKGGTGKNLFWEAVARIYGEYGGFITQFQLQSQFNDWASRKMFVIANEVLTRMELRHLVGYLKNLITEKRIPIEVKNMPVRMEDNRMQLVFLSNETRPLHIENEDRRYMVVRTPPPRDAAYYEAVDAEIAAGGAEAFYHFLLERQLGDFGPHTKPMMTESKGAIIELGMSTPQLFWRDIKDGEVDLPYGPCMTRHLYRGYLTYCGRIGDKNPAKLVQFSHEFMGMNGVSRKECRIIDPERPAPDGAVQRRVFLMGERPEGSTDDQWASAGSKQFYDALRLYMRNSAWSSGNSDADDFDAP